MMQLDSIKSSLLKSALNTPHLIYAEYQLKRNLDTLRAGFDKAEHYLAVKSCYALPVLQFFASAGMGAEVMSELEYSLCQKAGFLSENIILNGLGRRESFFERAVDDRALIIIDSQEDFMKIKKIAESGKRIRLGFRYAPDLGLPEDAFYQKTSHKLGSQKEDPLFCEFFTFLTSGKHNVRFELLHTHFAINNKSSDVYTHVVHDLSRTLKYVSERWPTVTLPEKISLGGGFHPYSPETVGEASAFFGDIQACFFKELKDFKLVVEPGRFLINSAGFVLTNVKDYKFKGNRHHIIIDAGTNVLIPIPSAHYAAAKTKSESDGPEDKTVVISDGVTSPDNVIVHDVMMAELPGIGETILLENCGAYTDVLSEFWVFDPYEASYMDGHGVLKTYRTRENIEIARMNMWGI